MKWKVRTALWFGRCVCRCTKEWFEECEGKGSQWSPMVIRLRRTWTTSSRRTMGDSVRGYHTVYHYRVSCIVLSY
jgi:hypothetical protein